MTKSAEELVYVREAARLSDLADRAAIEATAAGADEGEILADMHPAIFAAGGDYPGNEFIIGSAPTRCCAATRAVGASSPPTIS